MKRFQWVLALSALLLAQSGAALAQQAIKLGAVLSITGGASFIGEDQRSTLELKVKALSAEGRLSAWFLTAMPFLLYGAIRLLSRDYFGELAESLILVPALVYASISLVASNIIIYRMVNFKI